MEYIQGASLELHPPASRLLALWWRGLDLFSVLLTEQMWHMADVVPYYRGARHLAAA
ncbi:MAG TPA: hypothetical protein VNX22_00535 [Acidobacteriaceae bacterium]|nr:hypothetical protein [Acidobacteriaceae bacterium]